MTYKPRKPKAQTPKCHWCERETAIVKVALTTMDGELLDLVQLCDECRRTTPISVRDKRIDMA